MLPAPIQEALRTLAAALANDAALAGPLRDSFREHRTAGALEPAQLAAAELLVRGLPNQSRTEQGSAALKKQLAGPQAEVLLCWCEASTAHAEARLAPLLSALRAQPALELRVSALVRDRIVQGPLVDALGCAPLLGDGAALGAETNAQARARLEILIWEAGASATRVPALGAWIWKDESTFEAMIGEPAKGSLRGRVLAARCLEIAVGGISPMTDPALIGRTLQVLQPLLLHPEPLVWIHAARALGQLAGSFEQLEGTVLDWIQGPAPVLRQRAMTALSSLPAERLVALGHELEAALEVSGDENWVLAAAAAGTPYLFHERRELFDRVKARILAGEGGATAARALAHGFAALWRRGQKQSALREPMLELRRMARRAHTQSIEEWRRLLDVLALTDPVDGAERDPLDVERGLENLVHLASQYDDEEADARAARFAAALNATFAEASRIALGEGTLRHRAAALNALEGAARSLALRLWGPQLATHPNAERVAEPELSATWQSVASAPAEILKLVKERRAGGQASAADEALEVAAIRVGGYALDACAEQGIGPERGEVAHGTCLWIRQLDGLADGSRELSTPLKSALSAVFWRLVDATRGTALGAVDDVTWLGPFAAWWGLVIDRPALLQQLANALPMIADGALDTCCNHSDAIRRAMASGAPDGQWELEVDGALEALRAQGTELSRALSGLAAALRGFAEVKGGHPALDKACLELVLAAERLQASLADPEKALHPAREGEVSDSLSRAQTENAPRVAQLVARAIRARELSMLEVWFTSLGPIASGLVEAAVTGAVRRTPPPPPIPKKPAPQVIQGYELVRPIGEGGIGKVWLVRKPGADRLFVLKIPKVDALAGASETERAGMLASFVEEARALAGLYHPNVANIIDRGVADEVPFLVLELLIGADLQQYAKAKLMSLFELRQVVLDSCAGLEALHNAGLVHRDIKPGNLWLRLPLQGGESFDPQKHRDPARTQPLSAVVIDFGMVRAKRVTEDASGRFVAGTAGYIAPEQVLDPIELDGRADLYALVGTIVNLTKGRSFFDHITTARERIFAHMNKDPFEDATLLEGYPPELAKLLRAATAMNPKDRPGVLEFGRAFAQLV